MRSEYEGRPAAVPGNGAEWIVMIHSGGWTKEWRRALEQWRAASAENDLDFRQAESVWVMTGDLAEDPQIQAELAALRRQAHTVNGRDARSPDSWFMPSWRSRVAAAAAIGALVLSLTFLVSSEKGVARHETRFGQMETVKLPDGSSIAVNSESSIAVRYDRVRREVTLEKGEAKFDIAHDAFRPFTVLVRNGQVRALGTSFNIVREHDRVTVSLFEGSVGIDTRGDAGDSVILKAGESIAFLDNGAMVTADEITASQERVAAWRDNARWQFDELPVARIVGEYNRYAAKPILVFDARLAEHRMGGALRHGETDAFLAVLRQVTKARVEDRGDAYVLIPPPEGE